MGDGPAVDYQERDDRRKPGIQLVLSSHLPLCLDSKCDAMYRSIENQISEVGVNDKLKLDRTGKSIAAPIRILVPLLWGESSHLYMDIGLSEYSVHGVELLNRIGL